MTGTPPGVFHRPALPAGWRLVMLDSVGSTNDEARELAASGGGHGTIIWARRQEAGRGRRGRRWESPEGNLYCSVILRPDVPPSRAAELAFVVALALAETIAALVGPGPELRLKWPNDVLLGGRKVAGILLEAALAPTGGVVWVIAGTGVNIVSAPPDTIFPATSLRAAGHDGVAPAMVLERYAKALSEGDERWRQAGFAPVRHAWLARAWKLGEPLTVRRDHATVTGRFEDLDKDGALLLRQDDGAVRRVTAGDLFSGGG